MRRATSPKIVVGPNDSMPDVLTRLRTATGAPASLAIPAASSLFLTASEFRALKAAAEQTRITLTVETDDRLRKQLAMMFQIPVVDLLPSAVSDLENQPAETPPEPEPETASAPQPKPIAPDLPKLDLAPALEVTPKWEPREADEDDDTADDVPLPGPKRRPKLPVKPIALGMAVLAGIALVAFIVAYLLQSATVVVTVKRQQVSADITYAVVGPGAQAPAGALFAVNASPVTMEVQFQETIPVTGVERNPGQAATGKVALRNPAKQPVDIAEGTTFTDRNGIAYVFTQAVTVPAADGNSAGRAEGTIRAAAGGEAANREIGMLSGRLDNGVYYSNRDAAVAGGTDLKTPMVAQEDIDKLVADANAGVLQNAVTTPLTDGRKVLPGSLKADGALSYETDHQPGDKVDKVSISAKMVVSGVAFLPSEAEMPAKQQLQTDLQGRVPDGYELEPDSISFAEPVIVNDQGAAALYRLTATADARVILDDARRKALAEGVAGKSVADAEAFLRGQPEVQDATIDSSPGFLPKRIPSNTGRIEIETR